MNIISVQGIDEINVLCNAAFGATLKALLLQGIISKEQHDDFYRNNFALYAHKSGGFKNWLQNLFGKEAESMVIVVDSHYSKRILKKDTK